MRIDGRISDRFWSRMQEIIRTEGIPYQWEALNDRVKDAEPSYCMRNFRIAAHRETGKHKGFVFQDSDVAKWLEAVAYSLMWHQDSELEKTADEAIEIICAAQQPDGYLDTYYIIGEQEKRWTNLKDNHELYIAGHMIEAAVAYYQATGKRKLLDACIRLTEHIDERFGPEEEKLKGYPGHPVIELALIRLYEVTRNEKHLKLAEYFINQRGQSPLYFEEETEKYGNLFYWKESPYRFQYYQAGKPVREQTVAEGHAVRALYLYSGMADVARETGDRELQMACEKLWRDVTKRQMYITGAVGAAEYGEAFTFDYDLPNDTIYGESCASIALIFFALRMLRSEVKGEYGDIMEQVLYNGAISGMQLDGKRFFYVNPLEVLPEACEKDYGKRHVKPERQPWFACSCCPPNIIRLIASLAQYVAFAQKNTAYLHLYIGGEYPLELNKGTLWMKTEADYPVSGKVEIQLSPEFEGEYCFAIRIPQYCREYSLLVDGKEADYELRDGYAYLKLQGDAHILLRMRVENRLIQASPLVRENIGKVCIMRGPVVYCMEEADNGKQLQLFSVRANALMEEKYEPETLGGVTAIYVQGLKTDISKWEHSGDLYAEAQRSEKTEIRLKMIPYHVWANRGVGEMMTWIRMEN